MSANQNSSQDSSYEEEEAGDLNETKDRVCQFRQHAYRGPAYTCEDCNLLGCRDCLQDDGWEERVRDQIFLCYPCYQRFQNRMWMGRW